MKLQLPDSVLSSQDLKAAILEIQRYAQWYGQTVVKIRKSNHKGYPAPSISRPAIEIIEQWQGDQPINQSGLDGLIAALQDYAAAAPKIAITLAAPAPRSLKQDLAAWCRKNIDGRILVDFQFDSTMLGGMAVRYGSHIYDWSFRRQILEARPRFPEVLRNV